MILEKSYWMFYGIHELHCSINVYEKKHLASICFKWLVALKSRPSKNKIFIWRFILITYSIIYHYQKAKKGFFVVQKSLSIEKHLSVFIDRLAFRFHSDRVLGRL